MRPRARLPASFSANCATAVFAASTVTVHVPAPEHGPDQPRNTEPFAATALSTTLVPSTYVPEHVAPHEIEPGALVTAPLPVPCFATVSANVFLNVAVTDFESDIVTVHVPVPEQAPLQPVNTSVPLGVAVNVTVMSCQNVDEQVVPQLIPAGELATVPAPLPARATVSVLIGESFSLPKT